jgi:calcium-dependent protein kinase
VRTVCGKKELQELYKITKFLGEGSFGKVFMAENKSDPSHQVAIKIIGKSHLSPEDIKSIHDEVNILRKLDHPNIVKYYETYEDDKYIFLVMELCKGGDLFETITKKENSKVSE